MKLQTASNKYKASNNDINIDPETLHVTAYSYNWWKYIMTDTVGNIVLIDTTYSISTSKHQSDAKSVLRGLGIKVNLTLHYTTNAVTSTYNWRGREQGTIYQAINSEIVCIKDRIKNLIVGIKRKGSKRAKNEERRQAISTYWFRIKDLRNYRDNYIDKKLIPIARPKNKELFGYVGDDRYYFYKIFGYDTSTVRITNHLKRHFFRKQSGTYDYNGLANFIYKYGLKDSYTDIDLERIAPLIQLFGVKNKLAIIAYRYSLDTCNMLPCQDADPKDYNKLKSWITRNINSDRALTLFDLDKLHTYLTNKQNRIIYAPSEPVRVPLHAALIKAKELVPNDLDLIDTVARMRKEGRSQSHCIGSKHYIDSLFVGYQACNYKGYTFYLNPRLEVVETKGSHNRATPSSIINEFNNILQRAVESE